MKKTKTNEKLSLKTAVVTKLEQTLSEDQLKQVQGGVGGPTGGSSASSIC